MFGTLQYNTHNNDAKFVNQTHVFLAEKQGPQHTACDNCRVKKLRCSGRKSGCDRCKSISAPCVYSRNGGGRRSRQHERDASRFPKGNIESSDASDRRNKQDATSNQSSESGGRSSSSSTNSTSSNGVAAGASGNVSREQSPQAVLLAGGQSMHIETDEFCDIDATGVQYGLPLRDTDDFPFLDGNSLDDILADDFLPESLHFDAGQLMDTDGDNFMNDDEPHNLAFKTIARTRTGPAKGYDASHFVGHARNMSRNIREADEALILKSSTTQSSAGRLREFATIDRTSSLRGRDWGGANIHMQAAPATQQPWSARQVMQDEDMTMYSEPRTPQPAPCDCLLTMVHLLEGLETSVGVVSSGNMDMALSVHRSALIDCVKVVRCSVCMLQLEYIKLLSLVYEKVVDLCECITNAFMATSLAEPVATGLQRPGLSRTTSSSSSAKSLSQANQHDSSLPTSAQSNRQQTKNQQQQQQQQRWHSEGQAPQNFPFKTADYPPSMQDSHADSAIAFGRYSIESEAEREFIYHFLISQQQRKLRKLLLHVRQVLKEAGHATNGSPNFGAGTPLGGSGSGSIEASTAKMISHEARIKDMIACLQQFWATRRRSMMRMGMAQDL